MHTADTLDKFLHDPDYRIPVEYVDGALTVTHLSRVPLSLQIHDYSPKTGLFRIDYLDFTSDKSICVHVPDPTPDDSYASHYHNHNFYELMIVCRGEVRVLFEGEEYLCRIGDACIVNREIRHRDQGSADYRAVFLSILPEYLKQEPVSGCFTQRRHTGKYFSSFFRADQDNDLQRKRRYMVFTRRGSADAASRLMAELAALEDELRGRRPGREYMVCGELLRIFGLLSDGALYDAKLFDLGAAREQDVLQDACRYIDTRKRNISAEELAAAMNYSTHYLSGIFRKYLGKTVLQYTRENCLGEASRLLLQTDLSVSEIARRIGYENRTHFYRIFRERYGMTPQEYREQGPREG